MPANSIALADDLLRGAAAIAAFTGLPPRSIYHAYARKSLPIKHIEGLGLMARKSELAAFFTIEMVAAPEPEPEPERPRVRNPRARR